MLLFSEDVLLFSVLFTLKDAFIAKDWVLPSQSDNKVPSFTFLLSLGTIVVNGLSPIVGACLLLHEITNADKILNINIILFVNIMTSFYYYF